MRLRSAQSAVSALVLVCGVAHAEEPRVDKYGDPLPAAAIARLGTVRFRHGEGASFVAFLPGGKEVLSVGRDEYARIWDAGTGKEVRQFPLSAGSTAAVGRVACALTADGKKLAVTGSPTKVRMFDTADGKELWSIEARSANSELAFTSDGKTLAVQDQLNPVMLVEAATGRYIRRFPDRVLTNENYRVFARGGPVFSPDGKVLASGDLTSSAAAVPDLVMWNVATGKELHRITESNRLALRALAFSPDGKYLAWTKGNDGIVLADARTAKPVRHMTRAASPVIGGLVFSPDSKMLAAHDPFGREVVLWDTETAKEIRSFSNRAAAGTARPTLSGLCGVAFSPDSKRLAVASPGCAIRILTVETSAEAESPGHLSSIMGIGYTADGKTVVSTDADGVTEVWDAVRGKETRHSKPQDEQSVSLSPDAAYVAAHTLRGQIRLLESARWKQFVVPVQQSFPWYSSLAVSPAARQVAVSVARETSAADVLVLEAATGKEQHRFNMPYNSDSDDVRFGLASRRVSALRFSPDGRLLAAFYDFDHFLIWNLASGKEQCRIALGRSNALLTFAFSRDGKTLLADTGSETPALWETATGNARRDAPVRDVELRSGSRVGRFRAVNARVPAVRPMNTVALSADGRLLAHARPGGSIRLWDVGTKKEVAELKGHRADVNALAFAADGKTLVSGSADTTALIWDIHEFTAAAKGRTSRLEADARWSDLMNDDAGRAFDALHEFAAAGADAVAFIERNVRPATADAAEIEHLIADLDSEEFVERKKASAELHRLGESALPLLRKALDADPSPEARKRIEEILRKVDQAIPHGETLRTLRAIEALETIATPEAKEVLRKLAKGTAGAAVTQAAQEALDRQQR
jgi:WD40 repeat protein